MKMEFNFLKLYFQASEKKSRLTFLDCFALSLFVEVLNEMDGLKSRESVNFSSSLRGNGSDRARAQTDRRLSLHPYRS